MATRVSALLVCATLVAGCVTLPPTASFHSPRNTFGPVEANAWLKRVEITDPEMGYQESKEQVENTLTNNMLRFLREGKYFRQVELLPGKPQPEDHVLRFQFDRYRQERYLRGFLNYDASDLSAVLTITHPDGQLVIEVKASIKEEHKVFPFSLQAALPSGMNARTQIIEELLLKALFTLTAVP